MCFSPCFLGISTGDRRGWEIRAGDILKLVESRAMKWHQIGAENAQNPSNASCHINKRTARRCAQGKFHRAWD